MGRSVTPIQALTRLKTVADGDVLPFGPANSNGAKGITYSDFRAEVIADIESGLLGDNIGDGIVRRVNRLLGQCLVSIIKCKCIWTKWIHNAQCSCCGRISPGNCVIFSGLI